MGMRQLKRGPCEARMLTKRSICLWVIPPLWKGDSSVCASLNYMASFKFNQRNAIVRKFIGPDCTVESQWELIHSSWLSRHVLFWSPKNKLHTTLKFFLFYFLLLFLSFPQLPGKNLPLSPHQEIQVSRHVYWGSYCKLISFSSG